MHLIVEFPIFKVPFEYTPRDLSPFTFTVSVPPVLSTVDPCPVTIPYVPEVAVFPPDTVTEPVFVNFPCIGSHKPYRTV